jgi:hypothetical protein
MVVVPLVVELGEVAKGTLGLSRRFRTINDRTLAARRIRIRRRNPTTGIGNLRHGDWC